MENFGGGCDQVTPTVVTVPALGTAETVRFEVATTMVGSGRFESAGEICLVIEAEVDVHDHKFFQKLGDWKQ